MLLLDEPTNHLDMDARASLVDAINDFEGAVVLVSHDTHLVKMVADTLWLVAGGTVKPFDGDIDEYQAKLLKERGAKPVQSGEARPTQAARRTSARPPPTIAPSKAPLKKAVDSAEKMLARLTEQLERRPGQARRPDDLCRAPARRDRPAEGKGPPRARGRQCREALAVGAGSPRKPPPDGYSATADRRAARSL